MGIGLLLCVAWGVDQDVRMTQLTTPANDDQFLRSALAKEATRLAGLGFMACTAGNLSALVGAEPLRVLMSPSGMDKGQLQAEHFLLCNEKGQDMHGQRKPSDETQLHLALYEHVHVGAVCHGHPPHAVALSLSPLFARADHISFVGLEMCKAFAGTTTHLTPRVLPIVENSQDMGELSKSVLAIRNPHVPAVLVRGHGVYAWGRTVTEASRHLETVEWLCRVVLLARGCEGTTPLPHA